jgi:hypothetical protein
VRVTQRRRTANGRLFIVPVLLAFAVVGCGGSRAATTTDAGLSTTTSTNTSFADADAQRCAEILQDGGTVDDCQPRTSTQGSTVDFPGFLPAPGWQTVKTPETSSVVAANVALGPGTLSGDMPWDTVERLEDGDVVLVAMFIAPRESWGDDWGQSFPPRSLPLSLDDTVTDINYNFEGQPDHIYADRLGARVNGWAIDLLVFYGGGDPTAVPPVRTQPSAETRAAAQEQLARLVVPPRRTDG